MFIGTGADEAKRRSVHGCTLAHQAGDLHLAHSFGNAVERIDHQFRGNLVEQLVDALGADGFEHFPGVVVGVRYERHDVTLLAIYFV
jgi:hypothetical protein